MRMEISNRTPEQIASEINFIKEESGKMLLPKCCIDAPFELHPISLKNTLATKKALGL